MSVWSFTTAETWAFFGALLVTEAVLLWFLDRLPPRRFSGFDASNEWHRKLVEWERDRVLSVAKGLAVTGAGFLVAVFTAILENDVGAQVSAFSLLGCIGGAVGAVLLGAWMSVSTRDYTWKP